MLRALVRPSVHEMFLIQEFTADTSPENLDEPSAAGPLSQVTGCYWSGGRWRMSHWLSGILLLGDLQWDHRH